MPWRPANIAGKQDLLHVVNQLLRETNQRIDDLNNSIPLVVKGEGILNFGTIAANSAVERSIILTGIAPRGVPHASPKTSIGNANLTWSAYLSASSVIIRLLNPTGAGVTPNVVTWMVSVTQ